MGVHGLTTYLEENRHFFQDLKFRDSRLVIDGCSLYFSLYFNNGLDQQHGGDYDTFLCLLYQFFSSLASCNIQPYVVLDGGMDPSDKKFCTLRERLQSRIKEADSLSHGCRGSVLPLLTPAVFIQALQQCRVPLVQCPAEADWEIACLAHEWRCPVLTNDSDFYIFDLPGGYLPFRFFQWTNLNRKAPHPYISARRYTTNGLCRRFGGINRELLPLFAVLAGNDYAVPRGANTLLSLLDLSGPSGRQGEGGRKGRTRIEGLLVWLSSFRGPKEALEEVGRIMGEVVGDSRGRDNRLSSLLLAAMQEYRLKPHSSLSQWFSGGSLTPGGQSSPPSPLPECLSLAAARGMLPSFVLDVLVLRRVLLFPQVEHCKLASSHCSARPIRQAIYGILVQPEGRVRDNPLQGNGRGVQGVGAHVVKEPGGTPQRKEPQNSAQGDRGRGGRGGRGRGRAGQVGVQGHHSLNQSCSSQSKADVKAGWSESSNSASPAECVEEYDRHELNLKRSLVEAHPPIRPPRLDTIGQAPLPVRLDYLLNAFGVKESLLAPLPPHLQLAVVVTSFWLAEASPAPSQTQLQALILGFVYGELARTNQPGATDSQHLVRRPNFAAEQQVCAGLDRLRVRPGERRGMNVEVAHRFSQWQACLWSALCLNQLLLLPLPEPHIAWLFNGTLVHGLMRSLCGGWTPDSLLAGCSPAYNLYCSLQMLAPRCSSKTTSSSSSGGRRKRGSRRGRRGGRGQGPSQEMNNRFAMLMNEEEEEQDEEC
ncbi:single-strand DNA endonuclease ASTE1 [Aplochiton taeniatus]